MIGTRRSLTKAGGVPEQVLGERGLSCPPPGSPAPEHEAAAGRNEPD